MFTPLYPSLPQEDIVDAPEGPMCDRKCSQCDHEGMTYTARQLRGADEGQTIFYLCPNCRFQENENS